MNESFNRRLAAVERENRYWRALALALILSLGLLVSLGAQSIPTGTAPEEIRAKRFVLVNDDGNEQGYLNARSDGKVELALFGSGKSTVLFELEAAKSSFVMSGGNNLVSMTVSPNEAGFWLDGAYGRGVLYVSPNGPTMSLLGNDKRTPIWSAPPKQAAQSGKTWILWASMGRLDQAKGAWFGKADCEEQKMHHEARLREKELRVALVCLPEGVNPQGQR